MRERVAASEKGPRLARRTLPPLGKTPQSRPDPVRRASHQKNASVPVTPIKKDETAGSPRRSHPRNRLARPRTTLHQGTARAKRRPGPTNEGSKIHESLRVGSSPGRRKKPGRKFPQRPLGVPPPSKSFSPVTLENTAHVGVENDGRPVVSQGQNGSRGRSPDAREFEKPLESPRETPAVVLDHPSCGLMEVMRTAVVAESRPDPKHLVQLGPGERPDGRETPHERRVITPDGVDRRLLEHDLRNPDRIGPPVALPRKIVSSLGHEPAVESTEKVAPPPGVLGRDPFRWGALRRRVPGGHSPSPLTKR